VSHHDRHGGGRVQIVSLFAAVIGFFVFHGRNVTNGLEKSFIVEPPDPFEGGQFMINVNYKSCWRQLFFPFGATDFGSCVLFS